MLHSSDCFLSLQSLQVHWVTYLQYQKQPLFFLLWERVCSNQSNHPRSKNIHMNVYSVLEVSFFFFFFSFLPSIACGIWMFNIRERCFWLCLKMSKSKIIGTTQLFGFSNIECHWESGRRNALEKNERVCEERQRERVCVWERGQ